MTFCAGLPNAHLLRNLTFVGEDNPAHQAWTTAMAKLLIEIKEAVEAARSQFQPELEKSRQNEFLDRYDVILADAEHLIRGSPAVKNDQLNARNLHRRLVKSKAEVLLFVTDFAVPFDNTVRSATCEC